MHSPDTGRRQQGLSRLRPTPSLLDLPAEIWLHILRCLLIKCSSLSGGDTIIVPWTRWNPPEPRRKYYLSWYTAKSENTLSSQILRTNRTIYSEGVKILYGQNIFELNGDDIWVRPNFLNVIGPSNVARLRHLRLDHRNGGHFDCRESAYETSRSTPYSRGVLKDVSVERLFSVFPDLRRLETLSIAVDLPSLKMCDSMSDLKVASYYWESGLKNELDAAKARGDSRRYMELYRQVMLYINWLGIVRAAVSLEKMCPRLLANVYYASWRYGAYGIYSTKPRVTLDSAEYQKMAVQLCPIYRMEVDFEKGEAKEV